MPSYSSKKAMPYFRKQTAAGCVLFLFFLSGCAAVAEPFKVFWGSSTRALEQARDKALKKNYLCDYDRCFDLVLSIVKEKKYVIFIQDRIKERIVVMGIPGSLDTTEVGIFFSEPKKSNITVEVSSLSSTAKENAAKAIFDDLDAVFLPH